MVRTSGVHEEGMTNILGRETKIRPYQYYNSIYWVLRGQQNKISLYMRALYGGCLWLLKKMVNDNSLTAIN